MPVSTFSPWQQQRRPAGAGRGGSPRSRLGPGHPAATNNLDPAAFMQMLRNAVPNALTRPPGQFGGAPQVHPNSPAALLARAMQGGFSAPRISLPAVPIPNVPAVPIPRVPSPLEAFANVGRATAPVVAAGAGAVGAGAGAMAGPLGTVYNQLFGNSPTQGGNETGPAFAIRRLLSGQTGPGRAGAAGAEWLGADVKKFVNELTATPNNPGGIFGAMLMAESGGRQFDKNGKPLTSSAGAVGIAQIMPGTGPEAAKLAGLPWDPERYRNDPQYNAALGYAYFQQKLKENNGDTAKAVAAYNAGQGRVQQAERRAAATGQPFTNFLPAETQGYLQKVLGLASNFGAAAPAFDPAPYENAMVASNEAARLQSAPISAAFSEIPLPERPKPEEMQAPDYSAGDAAFEATRPQNPFDDPKERVRVQKQQFFKGIGQAMASLSGTEGIGTMLMKMGAGALVGRARGDEMIDEREAEFEKNMQEYNRALANREDGKAATLANVLNSNIQQRNLFAEKIWSDNVTKLNKYQPTVQGDRLITYTPDPNDPNKWTMNSVQLGFGPQSEALIRNANIGLQMGSAALGQANFQHQSQQATSRTALGLAVGLAAQQGNGQAALEGTATQAALQARAAVEADDWRRLFNSPERANQIEHDVKLGVFSALGVQLNEQGTPMMPLEGSALGQFRELYNEALSNRIYNEAIRLGQIDRLLTHSAGRNALVTQRAGNMRTSERQTPKGTTTTRSWSLDE